MEKGSYGREKDGSIGENLANILPEDRVKP